MKRGDLRQAIAVLKTIGIPELAVPKPQEPPRAQEPDPAREAMSVLAEIEALLKRPLVASELERANRLALSIARRAPQGRISNLAMQLMSCLHEARGTDELPEKCWLILARMRTALEEMQQA
jgi:hypothetical protein